MSDYRSVLAMALPSSFFVALRISPGSQVTDPWGRYKNNPSQNPRHVRDTISARWDHVINGVMGPLRWNNLMFQFIPGTLRRPLFLKVNPSKQGLFPTKTRVIWVPGIFFWPFIKKWVPFLLDRNFPNRRPYLFAYQTVGGGFWDFPWTKGLVDWEWLSTFHQFQIHQIDLATFTRKGLQNRFPLSILTQWPTAKYSFIQLSIGKWP